MMRIGEFWAEGELGSLEQDMGAKGGRGWWIRSTVLIILKVME